MFAFGKCCCAQRDVGDEQVFLGSPLDVPTGELAPALAAADRKTLHVPPDFSIRSVDSAASSGAGYVSLNDEQKEREMRKLQVMIRDFVMEFLQGVYLDAVLEDGSLVPCKCIMDSKLTVLVLQVHQTTRNIDLTSIQEICSGRELHDLRITTPLDELCVTLVMADDQCVSFKFCDVQGREHFATCMKVLRLALD
mmetsp:Transcript_65189/g.139583  ORF Transcript_65189/g.139583 Transcript_65189/m.139583 type:complete len:195 (-) Transcript_65189:106-690(-)